MQRSFARASWRAREQGVDLSEFEAPEEFRLGPKRHANLDIFVDLDSFASRAILKFSDVKGKYDDFRSRIAVLERNQSRRLARELVDELNRIAGEKIVRDGGFQEEELDALRDPFNRALDERLARIPEPQPSRRAPFGDQLTDFELRERVLTRLKKLGKLEQTQRTAARYEALDPREQDAVVRHLVRFARQLQVNPTEWTVRVFESLVGEAMREAGVA